MKYGIKMSDIAKEFGVSIVTVSNALSDRGGVRAGLAEAIKMRAMELGYRPSVSRKPRPQSAASNRATMPAYTVGILTPERFFGDQGTFYWELTQNVSRLLKKNHLSVLCETLTLRDEKQCVLPGLLAKQRINALIILGQLHSSYINLLLHVSLPVVFLDFYDEHYQIDSIISDSYYGGYLLTDYLISLGHRDIGFVGNVTATSSIHDRFMGYLKAMMEHELPYVREWTLDDRDANGVLLSEITFPEKLPTAFVCNCDITAEKVISSLKEMGHQVPEDISVVGYDNYVVSDMCVPAITTVEVNLAVMAQAAVDIVIKKLENPEYSEGKRIIPGRLLKKQSACAI